MTLMWGQFVISQPTNPYLYENSINRIEVGNVHSKDDAGDKWLSWRRYKLTVQKVLPWFSTWFNKTPFRRGLWFYTNCLVSRFVSVENSRKNFFGAMTRRIASVNSNSLIAICYHDLIIRGIETKFDYCILSYIFLIL